MSQKIYKIQGIVIEKRDWKEKDVLYTLITPDEGKVEVLAKHAKKVPSRHNSGLELFNVVSCQLYHGKLFPVVDQSKQIDHFFHIISDYEKLQTGFAILKLLKQLVAVQHPIKNLYAFVYKTFEVLNNVKNDKNDLILGIFTIKLLRMIGIFHLSSRCEQCEKELKNTIFLFRSHFMCANCSKGNGRNVSQELYNLLTFFSNNTFETILQKNIPHNFSQQTINILRCFMLEQ